MMIGGGTVTIQGSSIYENKARSVSLPIHRPMDSILGNTSQSCLIWKLSCTCHVWQMVS